MGIPTSTLKVQLGKEATNAWGVAVPQTLKLMGLNDFRLNPGVGVQQIQDLRGTRVPSYMSVIPKIEPTCTLRGLLLYEDFPFWMHSLVNYATKTGDSTSSGWTRLWCAPKQSSDSEDAASYTLGYGDPTGKVFSLTGATTRSLTVSARTGQPAEISVEMFGKIVATDTLDALSDRTVNASMGADWSLWIDPGSDTIATTPITNQAFSFEVVLRDTGGPMRHIGNRSPDAAQHGQLTGELSLVLELGTDSEPYLDGLVSATAAGVEKNIRLKSSNASTNELTIDFCGVIQGEPTVFADLDGVTTVDFRLSGTKTADSDWFRVTLLNNSSNL